MRYHLALAELDVVSVSIAGSALTLAIGSFVVSSVLAARAAGAAERSAASSETSASAAERSATASERSASATEESARVAAAVRYREDTPDFRLAPMAPRTGTLPIEVTMLSGPRLRIRRWDYIREVSFPIDNHGASEVKLDWEFRVDPPVELIKNASFVIYVDCEEFAVSALVRIFLECEEIADEGRRWPFVGETTWDSP